MQKEPPPFVWAAPDEKNILTCAFWDPSVFPACYTDLYAAGNFLIVRLLSPRDENWCQYDLM
jgi:hypothetical protein